MSGSARSGVTRTVQVVAGLALFGVGLLLGVRLTAPDREAAAERDAELAALQTQVDAAARTIQEHGERIERASARLAQASPEETTPEPNPRNDEGDDAPVHVESSDPDSTDDPDSRSPRVTPLPVPGAEDLLARIDVPLLAGLGRSLDELGRRNLALRDDDDDFEELPAGYYDGVCHLLAAAAADTVDRTADSWSWPELGHPAILANLMVQQLADHGLPASETVRGRLADAARHWMAEAARRERAHAEAERDGRAVPRLRRMVDRMDVNFGFVDEAFALLSREQADAIRPPETRGLAFADPYVASATIDWDIYSSEGGFETVAQFAFPIYEDRLQAVEIAKDWASKLQPDERGEAPVGPYSAADVELATAVQVRATTGAQARLLERFLDELELSPEARESLLTHDTVTFFAVEPTPR